MENIFHIIFHINNKVSWRARHRMTKLPPRLKGF
jgi:hypothetical protein